MGPKTFKTGESTVESSWLTEKLMGWPAFAMVDELYYLNDVSFFFLHVLFLLARTTRSAWWPCSSGIGKNFPKLIIGLLNYYLLVALAHTPCAFTSPKSNIPPRPHGPIYPHSIDKPHGSNHKSQSDKFKITNHNTLKDN